MSQNSEKQDALKPDQEKPRKRVLVGVLLISALVLLVLSIVFLAASGRIAAEFGKRTITVPISDFMLAHLPIAVTAPGLEWAMHSSELSVAETAIRHLKKFPDRAVGAIKRCALSDGYYTQNSALILADELKSKARPATKEIVSLVGRAEDSIQAKALRTLRSIHADCAEIEPTLIKGLDSKYTRVRTNAALTIGWLRCGGDKIFEKLLKLCNKGKQGRNPFPLHCYLWAVSRIDKDGRALPVYRKVLHNRKGAAQWLAASAIAKLGAKAKEAIPDLVHAYAEYVEALKQKRAAREYDFTLAVGIPRPGAPDGRSGKAIAHIRPEDLESAFVKALQATTGQNFGTDSEKWQSWWEKHNKQTKSKHTGEQQQPR